MTANTLRNWLARLAGHPVTFLLGINLACAALGIVQLAFTILVLRPVDLAVIGVLVAVGGVVAALLDLKSLDLTGKLFFDQPQHASVRRAGVLSTSLVINLAIAAAVTLVTAAVAVLLSPRLLGQPVSGWWIAVAAARTGGAEIVIALVAYLRLLGSFAASGWLRLGLQGVTTAATAIALTTWPSLDGYFLATAVATAFSVAAAGYVAMLHTRQVLGVTLSLAAHRQFLQTFLASQRYFAGASLIGAANLLGRSGDILILAALTNDAATGIYRVVRQGFDNLVVLTDAAYHFYGPTLTDALSAGRIAEFRMHRSRIVLLGLAVATGAVAGAELILAPLAAAFAPFYLAAIRPFEILAGLLVVKIGVHVWLWPLLVATGGVGRFAVLSFLGGLAQLAAMAGLATVGLLDPTTAAATSWVMAAITYGAPVGERMLRRSAVIWSRRGPSR